MPFPIRTDRPVFQPDRCVVLGKSEDPQGWIDCGNLPTLQPDPRVYVSHGGVLTLAKEFGYDIPALMEAAGRVVELEERLGQVEADMAEQERIISAIDVLESKDFRARRKPGRPKEKANA